MARTMTFLVGSATFLVEAGSQITIKHCVPHYARVDNLGIRSWRSPLFFRPDYCLVWHNPVLYPIPTVPRRESREHKRTLKRP
jgi:hypothetical protein